MLRKNALKKIFVSSLSCLIILSIYMIPGIENKIKYSDRIVYKTLNDSYCIYALNSDNFLIRYPVKIDEKSKEGIIRTLIFKSKYYVFPTGIKNSIGRNLKIEDISFNDNDAIINVNRMIDGKELESFIYSIFSIKNIDGIKLLINGKNINDIDSSFPKIFYREFGINKKYNIESRNDISKVILYYKFNINNNSYIVPVTKYVNDKRNKIDIVIDKLSYNYIYEDNLITTIKNINIGDYKIINDVLYIDLDDFKVNKKDLYLLNYSLFSNSSVRKIIYSYKKRTIFNVKRSKFS